MTYSPGSPPQSDEVTRLWASAGDYLDSRVNISVRADFEAES